MQISNIWVHFKSHISTPKWLSFNKIDNKNLPVINGNEYHVLLSDSEGDNNSSLFLIGDNGIGKTSLLDVIAGDSPVYYQHIDSQAKEFIDINPSEIRIIYASPGLRSMTLSEKRDWPNKKYINTSNVSIGRSVLEIFSEGPDGLKSLSESIHKSFDGINVSLAYNYSSHLGNWFPASYKYTFMDFVEGADPFIDNGWLDFSTYYHTLLQNFDNDKVKFIQWVRETALYKALAEYAPYIRDLVNRAKSEGNRTYYYSHDKGCTQYFTSLCDKSSHLIKMYDEGLDLNEIYLILLFDELKWVNIDILVSDTKSDNGNHFSASKLSKGEQLMVQFYSYFADIKEKDRHDILFIYDEPENSLHPAWQKEFPDILSKIALAFKIKKSNFIFATHSPLIVIRANKNDNVIKLEKCGNELVASRIEDLHHYSIESLLGDLFEFSYYSKETTETNDKILSERAQKYKKMESDFKERVNESNRIEVVNHSFDIMDSIDNMYNELFKK